MRMSLRLGFSATVGVVAAVFLFTGTAAAAPAAPATTTQDIPANFSTFVPCAAGGAGEMVALSGQIHAVFHVTETTDGGSSITSEFNPMGVSGVGQTTGATYRGTGNTSITVVTAPSGVQESTVVDNFRLIAPGPGNNLAVHETVHVSVDPQLTVTADVVHISVDCG